MRQSLNDIEKKTTEENVLSHNVSTNLLNSFKLTKEFTVCLEAKDKMIKSLQHKDGIIIIDNEDRRSYTNLQTGAVRNSIFLYDDSWNQIGKLSDYFQILVINTHNAIKEQYANKHFNQLLKEQQQTLIKKLNKANPENTYSIYNDILSICTSHSLSYEEYDIEPMMKATDDHFKRSQKDFDELYDKANYILQTQPVYSNNPDATTVANQILINRIT